MMDFQRYGTCCRMNDSGVQIENGSFARLIRANVYQELLPAAIGRSHQKPL
jgi:hypothetical protein